MLRKQSGSDRVNSTLSRLVTSRVPKNMLSNISIFSIPIWTYDVTHFFSINRTLSTHATTSNQKLLHVPVHVRWNVSLLTVAHAEQSNMRVNRVWLRIAPRCRDTDPNVEERPDREEHQASNHPRCGDVTQKHDVSQTYTPITTDCLLWFVIPCSTARIWVRYHEIKLTEKYIWF